MKKAIVIFSVATMILAGTCFAGDLPKTQVSQILENKMSLGLSQSQVKKLEVVERTVQQKMLEARAQADIRMAEIEKFTSDWNNMNGVAVLGLVKEYFKFMTDIKTAEVEAIIRAREVLDSNQLLKYQQLVSIQSLMVKMERELAAR
ncbi:MAG: hypothetical protein A2W25_06790 [candidate division Zixibacteria bacterium RBG_16_53_22]|nr:MAG: hypothetical protein A2W25_06790 [candidate division Zixibacteria bacterium RBG_16_53_22]